ncbi:MAG TPA: Ig-like domain-containing protein, partial [Nitrosopumilaceae archaeon]|nr:Ig-like domain-containing protein [Nitrosopumilaceae archaeon]
NIATFTTSALLGGTHSISAIYSGDVNFSGSTSQTQSQTVNNATPASTTTIISSNNNPSIVGQAVTFTATVTGSGGTPTGGVTFFDGVTTLGTGTLSGGFATYTTTTLAAGTHIITAVYGATPQFLSSTSQELNQIINSGSNCLPPNSGDWVITSSCTLTSSATAPANVIVQNNSKLTIPSGLSLDIDFIHYHLLVKSGSGVLVKSGGKIF